MLALLPASEVVVATVVSRCLIGRLADVCDQASSVVWRMAGLGLGPYPIMKRADSANPYTSSFAHGGATMVDVDQLELPDGYRSLLQTMQQRDKGRVVTVATASSSGYSLTVRSDLVSDARAQLDVLNRVDAYARVRFVQAMLVDAMHSLAPRNNKNKGIVHGFHNDQCHCGALWCSSQMLREGLDQIETDLVQVVLRLMRIADRQAHHQHKMFSWMRTVSHEPDTDAIVQLLPRLESKMTRLFQATPWMQMLHENKAT